MNMFVRKKESGSRTAERPPQKGNAPLVLVVDDEKNFREIITVKLEASGFAVVSAKSGKEALEFLKQSPPDLVLMDIHMPNETGTDVALAIKQDPKTAHTKIAFLSNLKEPWPAMVGDKKKIARELGMEEFIEKTDDLEILVKRVREILAGPQAVRAGKVSSDLLAYVRGSLAKGLSEEKVREALRGAGWDDEDVSAAFAEVRGAA